MIRKVLYATLASIALTVSAARAEDTIVWWDFLSGGDGVRMKAMLDEFNKEHAGKVKIDATTSNGARRSTPRCRPRRRRARVPT
jgi:multiple sugar transport system substrate-binding protein